MVHLKHPGLQLVVQHDVEAQKVAHEVRLLRLGRAVQVLQLWLDHEDGLDNYLLYLMPDHFGVLLVDLAVSPLTFELAPQNFLQP